MFILNFCLVNLIALLFHSLDFIMFRWILSKTTSLLLPFSYFSCWKNRKSSPKTSMVWSTFQQTLPPYQSHPKSHQQYQKCKKGECKEILRLMTILRVYALLSSGLKSFNFLSFPSTMDASLKMRLSFNSLNSFLKDSLICLLILRILFLSLE